MVAQEQAAKEAEEAREREKARAAQVAFLIEEAKMALDSEEWLVVLEKFSQARQSGYVLTATDQVTTEKAYKKEMARLRYWEKRVEADISKNQRPFMNPLDIEERKRVLGALHLQLTRARD